VHDQNGEDSSFMAPFSTRRQGNKSSKSSTIRSQQYITSYDIVCNCFMMYIDTNCYFSGVRSLILYVCFVDRCFSFCLFSFAQCVVCSSSIYGLWLPLWYLQTLHIECICGKNMSFADQIKNKYFRKHYGVPLYVSHVKGC